MAVQETLTSVLCLDTVLNVFNGLDWHEPPEHLSPLSLETTSARGLLYRAIPLESNPPRFAGTTSARNGVQGVAYEITDAETGACAVIAPDVGSFTPELEEALRKADVVLFDGTFWSDDELQSVTPTALTAHEMGHLPIWSSSLDVLSTLPARHKVYMHINNTNPILAPGSRERQHVERAGVLVGEDGMDFEL